MTDILLFIVAGLVGVLFGSATGSKASAAISITAFVALFIVLPIQMLFAGQYLDKVSGEELIEMFMPILIKDAAMIFVAGTITCIIMFVKNGMMEEIKKEYATQNIEETLEDEKDES